MTRGSADFHEAKRSKRDEFWTRRASIERELSHYRDSFRGLSVYCNCDDPLESEFPRYLAENMATLGIRSVTCTNLSTELHRTSYVARVSHVPEGFTVRSGRDMERLLSLSGNSMDVLSGDGDFRSDECMEILRESDAVVTNPPFSLFRGFFDLLVGNGKRFLVIGSVNHVGLSDVFPLVAERRVWLGPSIHSGAMRFGVPDDYPLDASVCGTDGDGPYIDVTGIRWLTNIGEPTYPDPIPLTETYDPERYPKFDNYDVINVGRVRDIPRDYEGVMGVPITFIDRYNPDQFEILEGSSRYGILDTWGRNAAIREARSHGNNVGGRATYFRIHVRNLHPERSGEVGR